MDVVDVLSCVSLFRDLSPSDRADLLPHVEVRTLRRKEGLQANGRPADALCFAVAGALKLVSSSALGRDTILDIVLPGDLVCGCAPIAGKAHCCRAVATEEGTRVAILPNDALFALLERRPDIVRPVFGGLMRNNGRMCRRVEEVASGQVERRLATLLLRLARRIGHPQEDGSLAIRVALSRQDLADLCGTTVETAIRVMSRLNREGVIRTVPRGFVANSLESLCELVRGTAAA